MPLSSDIDLSSIAAQLEYYSGADIQAVCREAALIALRSNLDTNQVVS